MGSTFLFALLYLDFYFLIIDGVKPIWYYDRDFLTFAAEL